MLINKLLNSNLVEKQAHQINGQINKMREKLLYQKKITQIVIKILSINMLDLLRYKIKNKQIYKKITIKVETKHKIKHLQKL